MTLTQLLVPESVLCNSDASSKKHAIEILSKLLVRCDDELVADDVFCSLIERERLGCTALERGIAIPHARFDEATRPIGAFIKLAEAIEFDGSGDEPVDLIFGLIVPADAGDEAARDFAAITRRFAEPAFLERLRAARSSRELYEALTADDVEAAPRQVGAAAR